MFKNYMKISKLPSLARFYTLKSALNHRKSHVRHQTIVTLKESF